MNFEDNQQTEADKRLYVQFFKLPIQDHAKSLEAGRPVFVEFDMVKIYTPGSRDNFVGDATPDYQRRFPTQWAAYKNGQNQSISGTPLNQLVWLTEAQIAEFKAVGCHTVEQLVGMPDSLSQKFMGHHAIKQRAQAYLDAAAGAAPLLQLQAELAERDSKIAELAKMVEALQAAQTRVPELPAKN